MPTFNRIVAGLVFLSAWPASAETRLTYSTYLGGVQEDWVERIAADAAGRAFVVGKTRSADFPAVQPAGAAGPFQRECSVGSGVFPFRFPCPDATGFFAILNDQGTALVRSTYFDGIADVAVDPAGGIYVAGTLDPRRTAATAGAWRTQAAGERAGFAAKLRADGSIVWLTYVNATVQAIAVDAAGSAYLTGTVAETDNWAPPAGSYQATLRGLSDAFAVKLHPDGTGIVWATFLGGTQGDTGKRIAVDRQGAATLLGTTESGDFPTTQGALEPSRTGPAPVFVTRLAPTGTSLQYSTYFGRAEIADLAVDAAGAAWLAGRAANQGYLGKLDAAGQRLTGSWTFGGNTTEARAVQVDATGNAYVAGATTSRAFPATADAWQRFHRGGTLTSFDVYRNVSLTSAEDGFLLKTAPDGQVLSASYLGGENIDRVNAIAVTGPDRVTLAGSTRSSAWPVTAGVVKREFVRGNCQRAQVGPNGPRDYHVSSWPCDEGFVTRLNLMPAAPGTAVVNAAGLTAGPVAPGTLVSVFGAGLGPERGVSFALVDGKVPTTAGGTQVLFDGVPGVVLYAQANQVNTIVPYRVEGKATVQIEVLYEGRRTDAGTVAVAGAAPALFTLNSTGAGGVAALNEDGSVNSPANPARRGSIVVFYATGAGQTEPEGVDGLPAAAPYPRSARPIRVWLQRTTVMESVFRFFAGFVPLDILYAGAAPGLVAGVQQINARISEFAQTGPAVPVVMEVSGYGPLGATLAIE